MQDINFDGFFAAIDAEREAFKSVDAAIEAFLASDNGTVATEALIAAAKSVDSLIAVRAAVSAVEKAIDAYKCNIDTAIDDVYAFEVAVTGRVHCNLVRLASNVIFASI